VNLVTLVDIADRGFARKDHARWARDARAGFGRKRWAWRQWERRGLGR
jgi:hypothetical protein